MAFVYRVIWAILLLLTFFDALMAYDGPKEAKIKVEILDSTYQFAGKGITMNMLDLRFFIGQQQKYKGGFGAISAKNGHPRFWITPTPSTKNPNRPALATAFQVNGDGTYTVLLTARESAKQEGFFSGNYLWLDQGLNLIEEFTSFIQPDFHGMLIASDGQAIYNSKIYTWEDFSFAGEGDSVKTESYNLHRYDPSTQKDTLIWDFRNSVTTQFILPINIKEGLPNSTIIDWSHPNSIYEDEDGDILYGTRHVGAGIISRQGEIIAWMGMPEEVIISHSLPVLKALTPGDYMVRRPHDFQQIKKGPFKGYYAFFDNGDEERHYSRVAVFDIDKEAKTISQVFEQRFTYSPFMGSVNFLDDGTYLVNVPYMPIPPRNFFGFAQKGQADSINYYINDCGSRIYWMNINGDTIAIYTTSDLTFVYSSRVISPSDPPVVEYAFSNDGRSLTLSAPENLENILWYQDGILFGEGHKIVTDKVGKDIYFTYNKGIGKAYSQLLSSILLIPD